MEIDNYCFLYFSDFIIGVVHLTLQMLRFDWPISRKNFTN